MSDTVSTVGDLSGKHVGIDTVRIEYGSSVVEGVISDLTFTAEYVNTIAESRHYCTRADIKLGDEFELHDFPMDTPAAIVTRSRAQ